MFRSCTRRDVLSGLLAASLAGVSGAVRAETAPFVPRRGLIILVDFPGLGRPISADFAKERLGLLDGYVRAMSYGAVGLEHRFSGWHTLSEDIGKFAISPVNLEVDKSRVMRLVQEAVDAAETEDFSRFDHVAIFMRAYFRDYGMVGLCGYPGMLGWRTDIGLKSRRGQPVPGGVAIFTASAHLGTLFHDCAHVWGGVRGGKRVVPCLYDHDIQARHPTIDTGWQEALINMGYWDPMSCHSRERSLPPPGISSWTKLRLGWLPLRKVHSVEAGRSEEILLGPLEDGNAETLAVRIPFTPTRSMLIENRQPIGRFDAALPGHGVLIMRCDDEVAECRHGRAPVKLIDADPKRKYLDGAAFSIPGRESYTDPATGVEIRLLEKVGFAYRIRVTRPAAS